MSRDNPYAVPGVLDPQPIVPNHRERLRAIAIAQRRVNLAVLAYLCLVGGNIAMLVLGQQFPGFALLFITLIRITAIGVIIFGAITVYRLAALLRGSVVAILYVIGLLIPCVGLLLLLTLSQKATKILQSEGVRVGLLGADPSSI
jgi:hypothetical protein